VFLDREHPTLLAYAAVFSVAIGVLLWISLRLIRSNTSNPEALRVTLTIGLLTFWCGQAFTDWLRRALLQLPTGAWITPRHVVAPAFLGVVWLIWRSTRFCSTLSRYLNVTLGLVLTVTVAQIGYQEWASRQRLERMVERFAAPVVNGTAPTMVSKPDVYNIVLDSFPSFLGMERQFGHTNSMLRRFLLEQGLTVNPDGRGNAGYTHVSLATSLNMDYPPPAKANNPMRNFI
jgi:hypothetical protein